MVRRAVDALDERLDAHLVHPAEPEQGLPRPLVVHARRGGALQLRPADPHRHFLAFFYVASPNLVTYRGPYAPLHGAVRLAGVQLGAADLLRGAGRPRHAADPPLGGARVHGVAGGAPRARLLHGCVPPAAGDQLADRRRRCCSAGSVRGSRATRCPTTCSRAPACGSSTRRCSRSRSSGRGWRSCSSAGEFPSAELLPAAVHPARAAHPAAADGAAGRAPVGRLAPDAHAVPRARDGPRTRSRVRRSGRVRAEGGRGRVRDVRGPGAAGRAVPDQPRVALRAVRPVHGVRRPHSPTSTSDGSKASCACGRTGSSTSSATRSPSCSCPAVVVPGVIFTILALWPFLEARVRRDHALHHFAQRAREAPVRSGVGAAGDHVVRRADAGREQRRAGEVPRRRGGHAQPGPEGPARRDPPARRGAAHVRDLPGPRSPGAATDLRASRVTFRRTAPKAAYEEPEPAPVRRVRRAATGRAGSPMRRACGRGGRSRRASRARRPSGCRDGDTEAGTATSSTSGGSSRHRRRSWWRGIVYVLIAWSLIRYRRRGSTIADDDLGRSSAPTSRWRWSTPRSRS